MYNATTGGSMKRFLLFLSMALLNQRGEVGTPPDDEAEKVKNAEAVLAKNKELLEANAKLKKEIEDKEAARKAEEIEKLKKAEDYKSLYEQSEKDKAASAEREKALAENLSKGAKLASVKSEMSKLGLNPERETAALRLIDLTSVKHDPTLNVVTGADQEAARLKMLSPEWFGQRDQENMDHENPDGNKPGKLTVEAYLKLSKEKQQEMYPQLMKDVAGVTVAPKKRF